MGAPSGRAAQTRGLRLLSRALQTQNTFRKELFRFRILRTNQCRSRRRQLKIGQANRKISSAALFNSPRPHTVTSSVFSIYHEVLTSFFFLFRAAPAAYGGSQARGRVRATPASLHHSRNNMGNMGSEPHLLPTSQLMVTWILNPLSSQGLNPYPHGYYSVHNPLCHKGNSPF